MQPSDYTKLLNPVIFLAEDDIDDQDLLEEALHSINPAIKLVSFSSGIKFLDHLESTETEALPGLIVLDYNIPELNGADILEHLNRNERYTPIAKVIWSTSDSKFYQKICMELGASAYLIKPSNISGIREVAEQMLAFYQDR